jgi:hypothetical protein
MLVSEKKCRNVVYGSKNDAKGILSKFDQSSVKSGSCLSVYLTVFALFPLPFFDYRTEESNSNRFLAIHYFIV